MIPSNNHSFNDFKLFKIFYQKENPTLIILSLHLKKESIITLFSVNLNSHLFILILNKCNLFFHFFKF